MRTTMARGVATVIAAGLVAVSAACASPVTASPDDEPVVWVDRNAVSLGTSAADGPLDDLEPLREFVDGAVVVGLGGGTSSSATSRR